ncbi:MAG: hypothetical protein IKA50_05145 [Clostridia bacterium]|nr:hypothetical protein [Clostridia bacterium]
MKKLLAFLLAVLMLVCLCACGDDNNAKDDNKINHTTQPVGNTENTDTEQTKIYYKTDAAGSTITTVIVLPGEGETFPIKTIAPTEESTASTASPTFTFEDDTAFNDATLAW